MRGERHVARDVVVLGGGPAGCAAAIVLARDGLNVLVVERSHYDDVRVGETLPPQSAMWLQKLGAPDVFASVPHVRAPRVVRLWEKPVAVNEPLRFDEQRHGWHIDRPRFDALMAKLAEKAGADVHRGAQALSARPRGEDGWRVQIESGDGRADVDARWVIDATGRRSWLVRRQGIRPSPLDRLVGLLGYGGRRSSDDRNLVVEATPNRWWYSAPLPGARAVAAFMTDSDLIARDGGTVESFWEEQRARSALIATMHGPDANVRSVVARTVRTRVVAAGRWVAVGDAAMSFDPLFGLGVTHALASAWFGARALVEASAGDATAMARYQAWCDARHRDYLEQRKRVYGGVARWRDSPFWERRAS